MLRTDIGFKPNVRPKVWFGEVEFMSPGCVVSQPNFLIHETLYIKDDKRVNRMCCSYCLHKYHIIRSCPILGAPIIGYY
jgi:hypothetical protein